MMTKCNNRYYMKKTRIHDKESPNTYLTLNDCMDIMNRQDKLLKLMEATLRTYDGKWLFDGSILSFAEVLNKLNEEDL